MNYDKNQDWRIKPTDRFILKWIKINLSARVTGVLIKKPWLRPWMITISSALLGAAAGLVFGLRLGWAAALMAATAQVLDGVDGQMARLGNTASPAGAFMDSVLDRYADGAMVIGMGVYVLRGNTVLADGAVIVLTALAVIGCNLISYSSARAETLDIDFGKATLVGKGTRTSVMVVCALGSVFWPILPLMGLLYLALHTNAVIVHRLWTSFRKRGPGYDSF